MGNELHIATLIFLSSSCYRKRRTSSYSRISAAPANTLKSGGIYSTEKSFSVLKRISRKAHGFTEAIVSTHMPDIESPIEAPIEYAAQVLISGLPAPLSYAIPPESNLEVGAEVVVELGRRQTKGWVVKKLPLCEALSEISTKSPRSQDSSPQLNFFQNSQAKVSASGLKAIRHSMQAFHPTQLRLFEWMASYYGSPLIDIIDNAIPKRQAGRSEQYARLTSEAKSKFSDATFLAALEKRSPVQGALLSQFLSSPEEPLAVAELSAKNNSARAALQSLQKKGYLEIYDELEFLEWQREKESLVLTRAQRRPDLTADQTQVVNALSAHLDEKVFKTALLFGVTGSGKTEVYLRAIEKVLAEGGSALVIVPEIALTPQLFDQFESRLSMPPALLHSQVGSGARWNAWNNMLSGRIRVAIGARSSVFAPLQDLRLIIVDEEHESSYKQSDGLRYHARDVAIMRGKFENAVVLLGSATPSFESLINAQKGRYSLLQLPHRVSARPLPEIEVVDLGKIKKREMPSENISPQLFEAIESTLNRKGQIVILYNRRGFSSFLQCTTCNEVYLCPHCSVPMTLHRGKSRVLCHYCNESQRVPSHCKFCRDPKTSRAEARTDSTSERSLEALESIGLLEARGAGTEKVVDEISLLFPAARIVRLDRDTTTTKDAYREILGKMRSGEADILVGTQMIAKGHDLPGVTLVGIVDADVGLHAPDFRSSERIFQLITQAAGRAGRGAEQGRVIVQTREPHHPTIVATVTGRFRAFARFELEHRKNLHYPPFGKLLRLIISSPDQQDAFQAAETVKLRIDQLKLHLAESSAKQHLPTEAPPQSIPSPDIRILGPAPAPHERLRGRYRWHILVKAQSSSTVSWLASQLYSWKSNLSVFKDSRLAIDVDPTEML